MNVADASFSDSTSVPLTTTLPKRSFWARSRAWIGILIMCPFVTLALLSPPAVREGSWPDLGLKFVGWLVFFSGATFRFWSTLYIAGRKSDVVVAQGPYSVTRNPLYLGTFLMGVSVAILLGSLTVAVGLVLATTVYLTVTVADEERFLRVKLGAPYAAYLERVPRLIPKWSLYHSEPMIEVNARGLRLEAQRALRYMCIPVICELITKIRDVPMFPLPFHMP